MSRPIQAMITCGLLLAVSEFGLRASLDVPKRTSGIPDGTYPMIVLGTSRTMFGIDPSVMESALRAGGVRDPWTANVSATGLTTVGMYLMYMEQVRSVLQGRPGVLAIEARPSGMNDHYLTQAENDAIADGTLRGAFAAGNIDADLRHGGRLASMARRWLGHLLLAGGRTTLMRLSERSESGTAAAFTTGLKGFETKSSRASDLEEERWRYHYQEVLLKGWSFGAIHTLALQTLIRQARSDGLQVALFIMPVTEIQRGFWPEDALAEAKAGIAKIAAEEHVRLHDFDTGHRLGLESFRDTHHLTTEAAQTFSAPFAREVFLPLAR